LFFSLIPALRAVRRIGAADKRAARGDTEGVLRAYSEALAILDQPGIDLKTAWCRSSATVALWGYCRAAAQLERTSEAIEVLERWHSRYLPWLAAPLTAEEGAYLQWFEDLLQWRANSGG
jgi:hypothetical protein